MNTNRVVRLELFGQDNRIKIDKRSDDLKHGYLKYYKPTRATIKRYLRLFDKIDNKIVVCHYDGYSLSVSSSNAIVCTEY